MLLALSCPAGTEGALRNQLSDALHHPLGLGLVPIAF